MSTTIKNISRTNVRSGKRIVFGDVVYDPGGICGPYLQPNIQFVIIHAGEAELTVVGRRHELGPDRAALLRIGGTHLFEFSRHQSTRHFWCSFDKEVLAASVVDRLRAAPLTTPLSARMRSIFEMALSVPREGGEEVDGLLEGLGAAFAHEYLLQTTMDSTDGTVHPESLVRALVCVERRFAESWTVASLAREANVSPNHLIRLFRTHLGETPAARLWRSRVRHGVELLRDTGLGVKEIAHRCGFKTPFHFSRMVAKFHGKPPRELRHDAWRGGGG